MVSCMGIPNLRNSQYKKLHRVESTPSTQIVSYHEILSVFNQSNFNVAKFPKFSPWAPINTVQCTIRTSTDATQESSGFQWRNSPVLCCGTQISEVPALNSEREGNETQHCPHFHWSGLPVLMGGTFINVEVMRYSRTVCNVEISDSPHSTLNIELTVTGPLLFKGVKEIHHPGIRQMH